MKTNITLSSTAVLFEFDTPRDRDTFWKGMEKSGFAAQGASERLGTRGINITTAKIRRSYAWLFQALEQTLANGSVEVKQVAKKADAPPAPTPARPVVPVAEPPPDVPMPEMNEVPPTATTEAPPVATPAATTTTPPKPVMDDPEPTGIHKNSRKYREWKSRNP